MTKFLKTFLIAGILFGAGMTLLMGFVDDSLIEGLWWGIPSGLIFGAAVAIPEMLLRKQFAGKYDCDAGESLLREGITRHMGAVSNIFKANAHAGYLHLTSGKIHFKPRKSNRALRETVIALADIVEASAFRPLGLHANGLRIRTTRADEHFIVDYGTNKEWAEAITRAKQG